MPPTRSRAASRERSPAKAAPRAGRKSAGSKAERLRELVGDALIDNAWMARLGRISFLGTLDRHPLSRRASNRREHSLGVAKLALDAAASLELPRDQAKTFVAACLLHDIGHYPLSHAAEAAFARTLGANHHEVGRWVILGDGPIGRERSLRPSLEVQDIDPAEVWALIDRSPSLSPALAPLAELLRAPINLDTLEGITRTARDFRVRKRNLPERLFTWVDTAGPEGGAELGIQREALAAADHFWLLKHRVYDRVINLPSNILAEARLCELVAARVDMGVFDELERFDDAALRRLLGDADFDDASLVDRDDRDYELWVSEDYGAVVAGDTQSLDREPLMVRTRKRYYVDRSVEPRGGQRGLGLSQWETRYRHEKTRAWVVSRRQDQLRLPLPQSAFEGARAPTSEEPEV